MSQILRHDPSVQVMDLRDGIQTNISLIQQRFDQICVQDTVIHTDTVISKVLG